MSVAIEAIATLVHMRDAMAELILQPAGIPRSLYQPFLERYDTVTRRPLSKRKLAPLVLDAVEKQPDGSKYVRAIVKIAANWTSYHLADDERQARVTVEWAREVLRKAEKQAGLEAEQRGREEAERRERQGREQEAEIQRQFDRLLLMFDHLVRDEHAQSRGLELEQLLNLTLNLFNIPLYEGSFRRNRGESKLMGPFGLTAGFTWSSANGARD